jgi:small-conductance mechanosensitive channel
MIWNVIRENGMEIPFPQREVRILNDERITVKPAEG